MFLFSAVFMFLSADILNALPLMAGVWPIALFFMFLGSNSSRAITFVRRLPAWLLLSMFGCALALIVWRAQSYGLTAIASNCYPDKLWIAFAIFGVLAIICLSECVGRVAYVRDALAFLGRNSLYIFALDLVASRLEWNAMMKFNISIPLVVVLTVHMAFLIASIKPCKFMIKKITPQGLVKV